MSTTNDPNWQQPEYLLRPEPTRPARATIGREESLRRLRRITNWSLAALLVGVGATSATLAHVLPGQSSPSVQTGTTQGGTGAVGSVSGHAPAVAGAVASSNPSQVVPGGGVTIPGQSPTVPGAPSRSSWTDS